MWLRDAGLRGAYCEGEEIEEVQRERSLSSQWIRSHVISNPAYLCWCLSRKPTLLQCFRFSPPERQRSSHLTITEFHEIDPNRDLGRTLSIGEKDKESTSRLVLDLLWGQQGGRLLQSPGTLWKDVEVGWGGEEPNSSWVKFFYTPITSWTMSSCFWPPVFFVFFFTFLRRDGAKWRFGRRRVKKEVPFVQLIFGNGIPETGGWAERDQVQSIPDGELKSTLPWEAGLQIKAKAAESRGWGGGMCLLAEKRARALLPTQMMSLELSKGLKGSVQSLLFFFLSSRWLSNLPWTHPISPHVSLCVCGCLSLAFLVSFLLSSWSKCFLFFKS